MPKNCGVDVLICVAISAAELAQRTALRRRRLLVRSPRAYASAASLGGSTWHVLDGFVSVRSSWRPAPLALFRARLPCVAPALKMIGGYVRSCLTVSSVTTTAVPGGALCDEELQRGCFDLRGNLDG